MFISFEGIDGSGKTTQIELLKKELVSQGYRVEVFREPGGTVVSEKIRGLLLNNDYDIDPISELLLFSAARAQLTAKKIRPLLNQNVIVILDRFYDSTIAYQGYGREVLNEAEIKKISAVATQRLKPDLTFYLEIPVKKAQERTNNFSGDRMERAGKAFYERVVHGYQQIAAQEDRFKTIDATQPIKHTQTHIADIVKPFLSGQ